MGKRASMEGSMYRRKSDGRWCAMLSVGGGRRRSFYGNSQQEVMAKLREAERSIEAGVDLAAGRISVATFADQYLNDVRESLRPASYEQYEFILRLHILPHIGRLTLSSVRPHHLQSIYSKSLEAGLSAATTHHVHKVAHLLFERAVRWSHITRNPAAAVDPPRVKAREVTTLDPVEFGRFCSAAHDTRYEALFLLAVSTGARVSELLALRWESVDWENRMLMISHSLRLRRGGAVLTEPKTRGSVRRVAMPIQVITALKAHRVRQSENALKLGSDYGNPLDLIFTTATGGAVDRKNLLRYEFRPILRAAGLPGRMTMHDLRHQFATTAIARGVPITLVAQALGHASPVTTMRVYAHVLPMTQHQVADVFETVLSDSTFDSNAGG